MSSCVSCRSFLVPFPKFFRRKNPIYFFISKRKLFCIIRHAMRLNDAKVWKWVWHTFFPMFWLKFSLSANLLQTALSAEYSCRRPCLWTGRSVGRTTNRLTNNPAKSSTISVENSVTKAYVTVCTRTLCVINKLYLFQMLITISSIL